MRCKSQTTPISAFFNEPCLRPLAAWHRALGLVCVAGDWISDGDSQLKEVRGLSYAFSCSESDEEISVLKESAAPPIREGVPDTTGANDYWPDLRQNDECNSLSAVIRRLCHRRDSKKAVVTLKPTKETPPCLVAVDFKIRHDALVTTAFFRSQDVWRRQPANMGLLYDLMVEVASGTSSVPLAVLVSVASAHVHAADMDAALACWRAAKMEWCNPLHPRPGAVAVVGREKLRLEDETHHHVLRLAREVGFRLAAAGLTIITGGLGGVMAAVSQGAHVVPGCTLGVLPGLTPDELHSRWINPYQTAVVRTGLDQRARIPMIVDSADVVLVINGGGGTRIEATRALGNGTPVVVLVGTGGVADELANQGNTANLYLEREPESAVARCLGLLAAIRE